MRPDAHVVEKSRPCGTSGQHPLGQRRVDPGPVDKQKFVEAFQGPERRVIAGFFDVPEPCLRGEGCFAAPAEQVFHIGFGACGCLLDGALESMTEEQVAQETDKNFANGSGRGLLGGVAGKERCKGQTAVFVFQLHLYGAPEQTVAVACRMEPERLVQQLRIHVSFRIVGAAVVVDEKNGGDGLAGGEQRLGDQRIARGGGENVVEKHGAVELDAQHGQAGEKKKNQNENRTALIASLVITAVGTTIFETPQCRFSSKTLALREPAAPGSRIPV